MFAKLKEERLTFTDFFKDFPTSDEKENRDMNTQESNISSMNLYQYLKTQKVKIETRKAKSRTQDKCKQGLSNKMAHTMRNISKVSIENTVNLKASILAPASLCCLDHKKSEVPSFKKHRTALLDSKKTDSLAKLLKINKQDSKSLTYRSNDPRAKSFMAKSTIKIQMKSQVFSKSKKRLNVAHDMSSVKKSQEPLRNSRVIGKYNNLDVLNFKTIESFAASNPSPRNAFSRTPFTVRTAINKLSTQDKVLSAKSKTEKIGELYAKKSRDYEDKTKPKVDLILAVIKENIESSKQSFCVKTLKLDNEQSKAILDVCSSDCFISDYAAELHQVSSDCNGFSSKIGQDVLIAVLDWVFELASELEYNRITTHLSLRLLYNFLGEADILNLDQLQLDALTCLMIAGKLEEVKSPDPKKLIKSLEPKHTLDDLINSEINVLAVVKPYLLNHNIFVVIQSIQLMWDSYVEANILAINPFFDFLPLFRSKSFDSYTLHKINSEMLDFSVSRFELLQQSPLSLACIVFSQALIKVSQASRPGLIDYICSFLLENGFIRSSEKFKELLTQCASLSDLRFDHSVPVSDNFKTYEDFLLTQTYNPELLR